MALLCEQPRLYVFEPHCFYYTCPSVDLGFCNMRESMNDRVFTEISLCIIDDYFHCFVSGLKSQMLCLCNVEIDVYNRHLVCHVLYLTNRKAMLKLYAFLNVFVTHANCDSYEVVNRHIDV